MSILAIITDMDGTVVNYPNEPYRSTWDAVGDALGGDLTKKWYEVRDYYSNKKGNGLEWTIEQLKLLEGFTEDELIQFLLPIPYAQDAREFFHSIDKDYLTGMVTGGFSLAAELVSEDLNLDFYLYNKLNFINPESITSMKNIHRKDQWLEEYLKENYSFMNMEEHICYIGDNGNDITMLEKVALPIVINPKNDRIKKIAYEITNFSEINDLIKEYDSKL